MNGRPTADQKRFHMWCRGQGCMITGFNNPAIHHIRGARMRLKGCRKAGEWYVIPLSYLWHQDGKNGSAIHVNKKKFEDGTGYTEKELWANLIDVYEYYNEKKPMSEDEYQIIMDRA